MIARLLVIAGSDSSGGAGIQADLKTAQAFGVYAQTAITAVTVQDTKDVTAVHPVPAEIVAGQIKMALNDIGADVIKIGMLGNGAIAAAVADALDGSSIPLVLDTVLLSSSGTPLLDAEGIDILKQRLMRRAALVTPNLPEAEVLTGIYPKSEHRLRNAAMVFKMLGVDHVLFKGGHAFDPLRPSHLSGATATSPTSASRAGEGEGDVVRDVLWSGGEFLPFEAPRQQTPHLHGTGCTLATAIACGLAQKLPLQDAVARAHAYVQEAIRTAPGLGQGAGPLNHLIT
ncbi:MAG TPA: bifunctional hydroxymethylpyrimidine kinase/phosphomethylpyrimidine kinase [Rhizomicrobium sp.]|nr:bifunctional hydroxymethylpyrimidine kinase/phosphomethylpyrimidine kinase [Rhizomicrobium sp.]